MNEFGQIKGFWFLFHTKELAQLAPELMKMGSVRHTWYNYPHPEVRNLFIPERENSANYWYTHDMVAR
jgi:hypothetical protein